MRSKERCQGGPQTKSPPPCCRFGPAAGWPRYEEARRREGCGNRAVDQRQQAVGLFVLEIASGGGLMAIVFVIVGFGVGLGQGPVAVVGIGVGDLLGFGVAEEEH